MSNEQKQKKALAAELGKAQAVVAFAGQMQDVRKAEKLVNHLNPVHVALVQSMRANNEQLGK